MVAFARVSAEEPAEVFGKGSLWVKMSLQTWYCSTAAVSEGCCCADGAKARGCSPALHRIGQTAGTGGCVCLVCHFYKWENRGTKVLQRAWGSCWFLAHFAAIGMFSLLRLPGCDSCSPSLGGTKVNWGQHGLAGAVASHWWAAREPSTMSPALTGSLSRCPGKKRVSAFTCSRVWLPTLMRGAHRRYCGDDGA